MPRLCSLLLLLGLVAPPALAAPPPPRDASATNPPPAAAIRPSFDADDLNGALGLTSGPQPDAILPHTARPAPPAAPMGPRVVLVVRHGEVSADGTGDPPLSAAGSQRAEALARIAASFDVGAAFVTPFRRTTHTAVPAADWLGLEPEAVPIPAAGVPAHVADLAERVRQASGAAVLVVGHSNTVPALVLALTGQTVPPIAESEYDRLYVVTLPAAGPPTVEERRY